MTSRYHNTKKLASKTTWILFQNGHAFYHVATILLFTRTEIYKENHYKSDHVDSFSYHEGILRGEVHLSMKKKVYKVTVSYSCESCWPPFS